MINLIKKGILFLKGEAVDIPEGIVLKKAHDLQNTRKGSNFYFLVLVGIITFMAYKIYKSSFIVTNILFPIFCIISTLVARNEIFIRRVMNDFLDKRGIKVKFIRNIILNKVLIYNSEFFADKLLYAYPFALVFKLLHVNLYHIVPYTGEGFYNYYMACHNYFISTIRSNLNILDVIYFGVCFTLPLMKENIFMLIESIFINYKSNKSYVRDSILTFICGYAFWALLIGVLFGAIIEGLASNLIPFLVFSGIFLLLFSAMFIFILPYIYENSSYAIKK